MNSLIKAGRYHVSSILALFCSEAGGWERLAENRTGDRNPESGEDWNFRIRMRKL